MKKVLKKVGIVIAILIGAIILFVAVSFVNHRIQLNRETGLFIPPGKMVTVNGNEMHVYTEGTGNTTLVFMSGGGTCSPTLDFKSLYSLLSDDYPIAVVEKAGYGFSEIANSNRDINTILEETREALKLSGQKAPYILFAHSMSGIEALYWAQKYPDEIKAIVGLDPAIPQSYENIALPSKFITSLASLAANTGITRIIPFVCNSSAAIEAGSLTEEEKQIYRAVFYCRTATKSMLNELNCIKDNAKKVKNGNTPQTIPMLFFISNGKGTGWDKEKWQNTLLDYIAQIPKGKTITLDCSHYVQDYEPNKIAQESKKFIKSIN